MDAKASRVGAASCASVVGIAVVITRSFVAAWRRRSARAVVSTVGGAVGSGSGSSVLTVNTVPIAIELRLMQCRCLGCLGIPNSVLPDLAFVRTAGHGAGWF